MTPAPRDAEALRQRLRRDRPTNIAMLAGLAAALPALLAWMGLVLAQNRAGDRGSPLYWLMLLPLLVWGKGLIDFSPWALRLVPAILIAAPAAAALALALALYTDMAPPAWLVALGVSGLAALVGWRFHRLSPLAAPNHGRN